jgi:hypothetical protein
MRGINWLGTIVGFVVAYLIGFVWFGLVFSDRWMELNGMDPNAEMAMSTADTIAMVVGALVTLFTVIGLSILLKALQVRTLMGGAKWGLFVGVFFAATQVAMRAIYSETPFGLDTWCLFSIDAGYPIVFLPVAGAFIGGIGKRA